MKIDFLPSGAATIIGLMSGTSVDGIDASLMRIWEEDSRLKWSLLHHRSTDWPPDLRLEILNACREDAPLQRINLLNTRLGEEFARAAIEAACAAGIPLQEIDAIASHGQTVWHEPTPMQVCGQNVTATTQIGDAAVIAARTGCMVVADFRSADMAAGGQGAPLVPFADYLLFADAAETRAVQNIGGIANVALIPAAGSLNDVVAFDTGPGNMVMDALVQRISGGRLQFDREGDLASAGQPNNVLLADLLTDPYFDAAPPKTTGREDFGASYAERFYAKAQALGLSNADMLATAAELTVVSIARAYQDFLLGKGSIDTVILGGGGANNPVLVAGLRARLVPAKIATHAEFGIPNSAKEAAAFALLGYATLRGRPSNVPSATGAMRPAVLGKISLPYRP